MPISLAIDTIGGSNFQGLHLHNIGSLHVGGSGLATSTLQVTGTFKVSSTSVFTGGVTLSGSLSVGTTLSVSGAATFSSTLNLSDFSLATHDHRAAIGGGQLDHGLALLGLLDDDHTQYVHNATARTISGVHTFNPAVAGAPFTLGVNAQGQLVGGLNADHVDGLDETAFVRVALARTITAVHTFNPGVVSAPFTLGVNATGQLVTGLNADQLDSQQGSFYQNATNINAGNLAYARMPTGAGTWAVGGNLTLSGGGLAWGAGASIPSSNNIDTQLSDAGISSILTASFVHDFGSILAHAASRATFVLAGTSVGDKVLIGFGNNTIDFALFFYGFVITAGSVEIVAVNASTNTVNPASLTFKVQVYKD